MSKFWCAAFAVVLVGLAGSEALAAKKAVKIEKKWSGSVEDEALLKGTPECITTAKGLGNLWTGWKLPGKVPDVDFSKEIVVVATNVGSRVSLSASLDDKGDLSPVGFGTRDIRPGFRYVLGTVSRAGVKTVNGKALPKE